MGTKAQASFPSTPYPSEDHSQKERVTLSTSLFLPTTCTQPIPSWTQSYLLCVLAPGPWLTYLFTVI